MGHSSVMFEALVFQVTYVDWKQFNKRILCVIGRIIFTSLYMRLYVCVFAWELSSFSFQKINRTEDGEEKNCQLSPKRLGNRWISVTKTYCIRLNFKCGFSVLFGNGCCCCLCCYCYLCLFIPECDCINGRQPESISFLRCYSSVSVCVCACMSFGSLEFVLQHFGMCIQGSMCAEV